MSGERVLVTGATGQVALPITRALARDNQVTALARFRDANARAELEGVGVRCLAVDIARDDLAAVPDEFDVVLNLAVVKSGRFDLDITANAEAAGLLMARCRGARAFLHCSSTGVYAPAGHHKLREVDPLGDNHRAIMPTYSIAKIAAEAVVRTAARQWDLPTTIARLNVPYGDNGGWPAFHLAQILNGDPVALHPERPNQFNPIHEDDLVAMIPALLSRASVPATIVNWAGDETVSIEEWCQYMAGLVGKDASFVVTDRTIASVTTDNTRMHELVGPTTVPWRDGFARMVNAST
ncbi:MAG TPA: NAD(P)-dependent oxidoreductase [Acidimicrobiia bacterium]|nr:NAD(P)-dependent oxidoreductase [Acidimicrobiia bacterium]